MGITQIVSHQSLLMAILEEGLGVLDKSASVEEIIESWMMRSWTLHARQASWSVVIGTCVLACLEYGGCMTPTRIIRDDACVQIINGEIRKLCWHNGGEEVEKAMVDSFLTRIVASA